LLWSIITTIVRPSAPERSLARERRHHLVDTDQLIAEHAADPLIAHVEPLGLARQHRRQPVQIDAAHLESRRARQRQPLALLLFCEGSRTDSSLPIAAATCWTPSIPVSPPNQRRIHRITSGFLRARDFLMGGKIRRVKALAKPPEH
jgi:hypothetical protein